MKTVLTSIITSLITVIIALFVVHTIVGDGGFMFSHDDDDKKECVEQKNECCDKKQHSEAEKHEMCMETLEPIRAEFETQLSDEEKATIEAIRAKFEDADHEDLCPEGMAKFQEQHKDDIAAVLAIADNHKEFFDEMFAKMHTKEAAAEGEVVKEDACPEAAKCKEATEKCKGEAKKVEKKAEPRKAEANKCKESSEKCEQECFNTFKIHFLLLDTECNHEDGDEHGHEH